MADADFGKQRKRGRKEIALTGRMFLVSLSSESTAARREKGTVTAGRPRRRLGSLIASSPLFSVHAQDRAPDSCPLLIPPTGPDPVSKLCPLVLLSPLLFRFSLRRWNGRDMEVSRRLARAVQAPFKMISRGGRACRRCNLGLG